MTGLLWIHDELAGFLVRTEQREEGVDEYHTQVVQVLGTETDGAGRVLLDVEQVWEAWTTSRTSAILTHDEAKWRVLGQRFDEAPIDECAACGADIDPLDADADFGHCGRCVGEAHALERAAS